MIRGEVPYPAAAQGDAAAARIVGHEISGMPPVFLHTGWRTRGTWIWSRFRAVPETTCFYEPLIETLAALTAKAIETRRPGNWPSGHPQMPRPYFTEFRPLLRDSAGGVPRYDATFAIESFFADPDAVLPALRDYIALLLQTASAASSQPVLKFVRSLGRIGWMQQNFPHAVHIAVARNPLAQFVSAQRHFRLYDNGYFLAMPLLLLTLHRERSDVACAVRHLAVALPSLAKRVTLSAGLAACEAHLRRSAPADRYRAFLAFWAVAAVSIPPDIDLIMDSDLLANSAKYRRQCEIDLGDLTGLSVDLSDAQRGDSPGSGLRRASELKPAEIWPAHHDAAAFLADRAGNTRADSPVLARLAAMLCYATLLGTSPLHVAGADLAGHAHDYGHEAAALAAVYASRSWRITAPLRWAARRLR